MIRVEGLYHYFRTPQGLINALEDVGLTLGPGEFVALVGRNGSGKSTLAKHLNALLLPDRGDVWVKGMNTRDSASLWEIRRTVGMVFQNPDNQLVATVVEEDVAFGPENLGIPPGEIRQRVEEALTTVGMQDYRSWAPHLLSGGQKQRVAIAGVLAMRPACLILDEATAMLDPEGRAEVMTTLDRLSREGITILHITHHMEEAVKADRVVVMEAGRIVLMGSPRQVFAQEQQLKRAGLDVPQMVELADHLRRRGLEIPPGVITVEEMVQALEGSGT
ncbi:MAG: energy-coupling factor transporter ATPase [Firmicutes bacterium]|nr:energy-coupling factor transporter ATPase [Bacillota bacterium]MCL5038973.1 energy-coupling factor transporter ATPase [Bacillota bacterium]